MRVNFFFSVSIGEFKSCGNLFLLDDNPDGDLIIIDVLLSTDLAIGDDRDHDLRFVFFFSMSIGEFNSSCIFLLLDEVK